MNVNEKLFDFIKEAKNAYHATAAVKERLVSVGYREADFGSGEPLAEGKYFTVKNGSSIIAFRYSKEQSGFMICASHSDSPSFKLKFNRQPGSDYTRLEVEKYGGMICYSWLDRPLSVAGRVSLKTDTGIESRLVDIDSNLAVIPSVAIHFNRGVNDGYKFNPASDMLPLISTGSADILEIVASKLGVSVSDILAHDLFLYVRERGCVFGANSDMILSPRLDDLASAFASLEAFLSADDGASCPVLAIFDNEEVGSETKQGAASTFLSDTLRAIAGDSYGKMLENSFMISADNAHAKHPNHPELSDARNAPVMNGGVTLKYNANQKYTTDSYSAAVFKTLASRAGITVQDFANRADMPGGSTLGSISNTRVSVPTVDIGLPQLAMHSANETCGAKDLSDMIKVLRELYSSSLCKKGERVDIIRNK